MRSWRYAVGALLCSARGCATLRLRLFPPDRPYGKNPAAEVAAAGEDAGQKTRAQSEQMRV
jgi:hypothetical protein